MANIRQLITTGTSSGKGEAIRNGSTVLNQAITLLNQVETRLGTTEGGLNVLVGVPGLIDEIYSQLEVLENEISLTVSSAEITKLTQTYDNQTVTQIAVEPTIIDLAPGDTLRIGNIEDPENPFIFEVGGSIVVVVGSETIPVQGVGNVGTVTITAASGSPVVLDGFSVLTKIQLLSDAIILKAEESYVDQLNDEIVDLQSQITILSDQISLVTQQGSAVEIGVTTANYSGSISSITLVDPIPIDLPLGSLLLLDSVEKIEIYTTANYLAANNVTTLAIDDGDGNPIVLSQQIDAPASVFLAGNLLLSRIQLLADQINSTVSSFSRINSICRLTSQVTSGAAITSISVTPLTTPLEVGDQLLIYNKDTLDVQSVVVSQAKETTLVNTTISIDSVTPSVSFPTDSGIHVRESYAFSKIKQTKDSIASQVDKFSIAGSIGVLSVSYNENRNVIVLSYGIPYDIKTNDKFYIIDKQTGTSYPITLAQNANAGATSLTIQTAFLNTAIGSGVHVDTGLLRSTVTQTASSITSVVESVSTAGAFVTTTATYNETRTSLAVSAVPASLITGQKLYVINRENGNTYPIVLSQNANAGATTIFINSTTVIATSGSGVHLDVSDYKTVINQTAQGITLQAASLYGTLFVGQTSTQYNSGSSTISISGGTKSFVSSGDTIIIATGTNKDVVYTTTTTSSAAVGSSTLNISAIFNTFASGANVYLSATQSSGQINVLSNQVSLSVTRPALRDYLNGSFVGRVSSSGGSSVTLISSPTFTIFANDVLRFLPNPDFSQTETTNAPFDITVSSVVSTTINFTTSLPISATNMLVYLERGGAQRTGSQFNVYADSITVDTPVLRSFNYSAGSAGWAIKGNGSAEFNSITARGTMQSTSYSQGSSGWRILADGTAEFNSVTVRGNFETTASSGNYVKLLTTNGEVLSYASSTTANSGGLHVLSNSPNSSRYGLTLHENGFASKQSTRKFTIYHNNDVAAGGSLVFQYSVGTPSIKFWGVADPQRPAVTAGTFEAVGNSGFYGNFYKANDKEVQFNVTDAASSSVFRISKTVGSFHTTAGSVAGYILVHINNDIYKMPFYNQS